MNVLIEQSSRAYLDKMRRWLDVAIEEGVRFFVTSLGNPRWVVDRVRPVGGVVYHDVTERKWALKALEDRKSTRLNSSHPSISYAVFCLKKKKQIHKTLDSHCNAFQLIFPVFTSIII